MTFFKRSRDDAAHSSDQAMSEEMRFHVEMEAQDLERMGVPAEEARRRALATFGGVRRYTEEGREARGANRLDDLMRDLRYSLRSLRRTPGYAVVVVLTLALGIAASTSIFSVANGVLFKRLPYPDPSRLMVVWDGLEMVDVPEAWVTGPEVKRLRAELKSFEGFAAIRAGSGTIAADRDLEPEEVPMSFVSADFFKLLGVGPELGRSFAVGDDAPGAPRVAVISRRLFVQRLAGNPAALGKTILIDGQPTTVIGVLPPDFHFTPQTSLGSPSVDADVYATLTDTLERLPRTNHSLGVLARVRPGTPVRSALAELGTLGKRVDTESYGGKGFHFAPVLLQERLVRDVRPALLALLGAVGMLMLIMSANLAVLSMARASRREHELTVRRAIGASQGRVARQILAETVLLALAGGVLGTLLGAWALRGLLALSPPGLPRRNEIHIDLTVLAVTLAVALVVGVAMGLAPVFQARRSDLASVLREKAPSRLGGRARRALLLGQLALSMMLLAGTGLLLGSFMKVMRVDPGFQPNGLLTIQVTATRAKYSAGPAVLDLFNRYEGALRALPGVVSVSATSAPPLSAGADQSGLGFPTSPTNIGTREHDFQLVDIAPVTPDYMRTLRIGLLAGREFGSGERDTATARVAIIDDVLASRYFPGGNAIGKPVTIDGDTLTVVGAANHVRMYNLEEPGRGQVWVPHARTPYRSMTIIARTSGDPLALADAARRAIHAVDPEQAIAAVGTMETAVRDSLAQRRLVLVLVGMFAGSAMLLVALGIYGITATAVAQRTRELGIRMALGASRKRVILGVLGEPTRLVAAGLVAGLVGTYLLGRVVQRMLYGISATDPLILVAVSFVLLLIAALASYIPARRATRVDPMVALRAE